MPGTLTISTLSDGTNSTSATNPIVGSPKAWGSYGYVNNGSTPSLRSAYNISSITRNSSGDYTFAFTNSMANSNFGVVCMAIYPTLQAMGAQVITKTTSNFRAYVWYPTSFVGGATYYDYGIDFVVTGT